MTPRPAVDVVVPSYGRPDALERCLRALRDQTVPAERVVVVARQGDAPTLALLAEAPLPVRWTTVRERGISAALRAGVALTTSEVVAFTDDDARPRPDWVARLAAWFARSDVDAVGGRDVQADQPVDATKVVGRLHRWGRMTGEHHVGCGVPRDVDVLKGVNLAVRAAALGLPRSGLLEVAGNDPHNELVTLAWVRRHGGRIVYDPAVVVDHDLAPRLGDSRLGAAAEPPEVVFATAANRVIGACAVEPARLPVQLAYGVLVGTRESPGLARAVVAGCRGESVVVDRLGPSLRGQLIGGWRVVTRRERPVVTCAELRAA
jgi:glycosyltransferase involved in cell wall biosynthesis